MSEQLDVYRLLPPEQFVSQPVRFVRNPVDLWRSAHCPDQPMAVGTPISGGEEAHFGGPAGPAYLERYGGMGIGRNGGGARCALYRGLVVKGFGASALAGRGQDYWHSFGGMSLREAVREAIWGAMLNHLLPHGAVETEAVVLTGSEVPFHYPDSAGQTRGPRALSFRRPFVRLAHFLPATLFLPDQAHAGKLLSDDARTRASILALPLVLARLFGQRVGGAELVLQLKMLFSRYGVQTGAARALRLVHGSITASNIGIDGRVLDFGMTSAVSDFGRIRTVRGFPDAWNQSIDLRHAIPVLLRYCARHLDFGSRLDVGACASELVATLHDAEAMAYESGLIDQVGIPREFLSSMAPQSLAELGKTLREISEAGCEPFKVLSPCDAYRPQMPDAMGRYHLGRVLASYWVGVLCGDWGPFIVHLGSQALRERLRSALDSGWRMLLAHHPTLDAATAARLALSECVRRHDSLAQLQHTKLNAEIDRLAPSREEVSRFVDCTLSTALRQLAPPSWQRREVSSSDRGLAGAKPPSQKTQPCLC